MFSGIRKKIRIPVKKKIDFFLRHLWLFNYYISLYHFFDYAKFHTDPDTEKRVQTEPEIGFRIKEMKLFIKIRHK
jgi:hypothetical protein